MNNLAMVILDGNLTGDPRSRTIGEKTVTTFSVAINHAPANRDKNPYVSYIDVETWDRLADNCAAYLLKGRKVTIHGNLLQDRWVDDQGTKRNRIKVVAQMVRFDSLPREGNGVQTEEKKDEVKSEVA